MLIGRQRELFAIDQALAAARLGKSSRLVIRGEPGIGKTALLQYAVEQAGSMRVLSCRGVEFEADVPFAGLSELLQPALGLLDRLPPMHAEALRSSLGLGRRIEADRLIVGAAVLGLISVYADDAPVLMTVDDAQWLDRASAEAVGFAARRLVADPVAVLVAVREGEESLLLGAGLPELMLTGLDDVAAAELLAGVGAGSVTGEAVHRLVEATGGNPLALMQLGPEASRLAVTPNQNLPVATSLERVYLRRAAGLSENARRVLLLVAASGGSDLGLVRQAARGMEVDAAAVEEAEAATALVLQRGDRIEFVHPLARASIYHSASPADRRAAHRVLAGAMTDADDADRRAWHMASAAPSWDDEAAAALEAAAHRARESSGYAAAAAAFAESARLTEPDQLRAARLFMAAESSWLGGRAEDAEKSLKAARKVAGSDLRVEIDSLDGHIAMRRGSVLEGYRTLVAAAETVEPRDRLKALRILADAALSAFGAGKSEEMLVAARRALELLRPDDPPQAGIFAHVAYGAAAIMAGRGDDGPRHLHESVPLFRQLPEDSSDPLLVMCAGVTGLWLREAGAGREMLDRALVQARDHAPAAALPFVLFMLGRDAFATNRWPVARAYYEDAMRLARETTQLIWVSGVVSGLAWLDALEGRAEACRANAVEGLELSELLGMALYRSWAMIAMGMLELGLGHPEAALRQLLACEAFLDEIAISDPDLSPAPEIVDALVRLGRNSEAQEVAARYAAAAAAKGQPFAMARAARSEALVADDSSFVGLFGAALRHHESTPDSFERARTQLYFGERLRRKRKRVEARKQLREALKAFDQLGAAPWAERALTELQASGETARVRDERYRQQLTPQELQVALTLAEGTTTREAAARLYLSPKTVEYHLRHVYDKLEIRSREELHAALSTHARPSAAYKTLMFTDLSGSTSLVEAIGDAAWHDLTAWLDAELRRCFTEHHGQEVDHAGDGFFVIFDDANDAIGCAVTIQRRLSSHRRLHGYAPQVRIGIHAGEVQMENGAVRGAAVHRAARLCAVARAEKIIVSREALEAGGRPARILHEYALKGIKEKVAAAEVAWEGNS
ncbi:MAG TPA: AAA family ATPase [Candidatus Dormibacteraeota bacterium]|nr:AAA family ATPase [Candidatus Dormibacteraeota bacterium]